MYDIESETVLHELTEYQLTAKFNLLIHRRTTAFRKPRKAITRIETVHIGKRKEKAHHLRDASSLF
jgi:hypothetical protein